MRRLLGRLVLIAVLVFGVWYVVDHYVGTNRFGCSASGVVAHADTNDCPASIRQAAADPRWASARLATIRRTGMATTGLYYDPDGHETRFSSGEDADAGRVNQLLHQVGVRFPRGGSMHPASAHVEAKTAARMRDEDVTCGVLVINNPGGVCTGNYGCQQVLAAILPAGATLVVWWPPTIRDGKPDEFTGRSRQ